LNRRNGDELTRGDGWEIPVHPHGIDVNDLMKEAVGHWNPFWFRDKVHTGGDWDFKQDGEQYRDFGNFVYGATGKSMFGEFGFPDHTLLNEAGVAHQKDHPEEYHPEWGEPGPRWNPFFGGSGSYGDQPWDQAQIKNGINYHNVQYLNKYSPFAPYY